MRRSRGQSCSDPRPLKPDYPCEVHTIHDAGRLQLGEQKGDIARVDEGTATLPRRWTLPPPEGRFLQQRHRQSPQFLIVLDDHGDSVYSASCRFWASLVLLEPAVPLTGGLSEELVTGALLAGASRHRSDQSQSNPRNIRKILPSVKAKIKTHILCSKRLTYVHVKHRHINID